MVLILRDVCHRDVPSVFAVCSETDRRSSTGDGQKKGIAGGVHIIRGDCDRGMGCWYDQCVNLIVVHRYSNAEGNISSEQEPLGHRQAVGFFLLMRISIEPLIESAYLIKILSFIH
jgi:hypothetical protein